jgi:hypothetical protein
MATIATLVRDYLKAHPGAKAAEITRVLKQNGIITSLNYVTTIISSARKVATAEPAATAVETHVAAITMIDDAKKEAATEKRTDLLTLDQIKMFAQAIKRIRSRSH